ncbi:hypothetical protein D3C80_735360 [compost metagenome]
MATDTLEKITASAFGTLSAGTSRIAVAVDIAQKPPMAIPSSKRPNSNTFRVGANATSRLEIICSTEKNISTQRRSIFFVAGVISKPVTSATSAVAVTACPAMPSVTPRLAAIGVNKLAGKNSAVIRPNTPSPSE